MTAREWQELEPLLERAVGLEDNALHEWLRRAPDDVRALLSDSPEFGSWAAESAARLIRSRPQLTVPSTLDHYRVIRHIASGGMGEVYEAEDPRLKRKVAIKVLHAGAVRSLDDEAQALARLRHPNICRVYDVGRAGEIEYFVMELLDGIPLSDRLKKGPLPLAEALSIGRALASALAEAHRIGIVHRDVKPANILLTRNGPSLVDFGIADITNAGAGTPAGTPPYMAPEQARGVSDPRSDIYSAGAVLREMTRDDAPSAVRNVIESCLREDPEERWQSAADLARALDWLVEPVQARATQPWWRRWWIGYVAAGLVGIVAIAWILVRTEKPHSPLLVPLRAPRNHPILIPQHIAVSPDATRVAFIAPGEAGEPLVWIRLLSEMTAKSLPATVGASMVFWSPDDQSIGLVRGRDKLETLHLASGALRDLLKTPGPVRRAVWSDDGHILYSIWNLQQNSVIYRIPASGGSPQRLTAIGEAQDELYHDYPLPLAGGDRFLFVAGSNPVSFSAGEPGTTYLVSAQAGGQRTLLFRGALPVGTAGDRVYYMREDKLWSRRLNIASGEWNGEQRLEVSGVSWAQVTPSGVVTYMPLAEKRRPAWVDRQGSKLADVPVPEGDIAAVDVSPDGTALVTRKEDQSAAVGLWVVRGDKAQRIGSELGRYIYPKWSADGKWIYFMGHETGLHRRLPVAGAEEELVMPRNHEDKALGSTTQDGRFAYIVALDSSSGRGFDIIRFDLRHGIRQDWSVTEANETLPRLSPDDRWIAWLCEFSSGAGRVCVSPRDQPRRITYVTSIPAREVRWDRDGRQLYFTSEGWLHAVRLSFADGKIVPSAPERLFQMSAFVSSQSSYAVYTDSRFLVRDMYRPAQDPILILNSGAK